MLLRDTGCVEARKCLLRTAPRYALRPVVGSERSGASSPSGPFGPGNGTIWFQLCDDFVRRFFWVRLVPLACPPRGRHDRAGEPRAADGPSRVDATRAAQQRESHATRQRRLGGARVLDGAGRLGGTMRASTRHEVGAGSQVLRARGRAKCLARRAPTRAYLRRLEAFR